jgi:ubiquinone/menaquinone biosynthesis C-methylase UbiE
MALFEKFAYIYAKGEYTGFSRRMAELLPSVLQAYGVSPRTILDVACGEGTFAVAMAEKGFTVTGLDISPNMLKSARDRAGNANVNVEFVLGDMRLLDFETEFDLVTCWFDSLNYLLDLDRLRSAFKGVYRALRPGGLFIFDMNTIHGLAVIWGRSSCYVEHDTSQIFEVHRQEYDHERNMATMKITGFLKEGNTWIRIDEDHRERGYRIDDIAGCLNDCGFDELARWGNLEEMTELRADSGRVWFVARRPAADQCR